MPRTKFKSYFDSISATTPIRRKAEEYLTVFEDLSGESVIRVFATNPPNETGGRANAKSLAAPFDSLWGFTDHFWLEARSAFTPGDVDVDVCAYKESVKYLGVQYRQGTPPSNFTEKSWMQVEVATRAVSYSTLIATGANCGELWKVAVELLRPNLLGRGPSDEEIGRAN